MQEKKTLFGGYDPQPIRDRGNHGGGAGDRRTVSHTSERCAVSVRWSMDEARWLECGEAAVRRVVFNGAAVPMCGGCASKASRSQLVLVQS